MTSEAVFIQVGALADGFAPHGNLPPPPACPQAKPLPFMSPEASRSS
jgi:hypothetical protein